MRNDLMSRRKLFVNSTGLPSAAEIFDIGLAFADSRRPIITSLTDVVSGSAFRGDSQVEGGSPENSATNYPIIQLTRIGSEQVLFPLSDPATNRSDTSFAAETIPQPRHSFRIDAIEQQSLLMPFGGCTKLVTIQRRK
jgi:hypothetical protein